MLGDAYPFESYLSSIFMVNCFILGSRVVASRQLAALWIMPLPFYPSS